MQAFRNSWEVEQYDQYVTGNDFLEVRPTLLSAGTPIEVFFSAYQYKDHTIRVFNSLGQELSIIEKEVQPFVNQSVELDTWNLQRGVYYLVIDNGKNPITRKFLIQ